MTERWLPPPGWGNYSLREFVEIPRPETVSLFPATAAWWWPAGLVLLVLGGLIFNGVKKWRRNRYRRDALARLELLHAADEPGNTWPDLPVLLKATAIHAYGRAAVASLHGEKWLEFLSDKAPNAGFNGPAGQALLEVDYLPRERWEHVAASADLLFDACASWIKQHAAPTEVPASLPPIVNRKSSIRNA